MAQLIYQNKKIYYRKAGTGNPVMLVHGFGEDGNIWQNSMEALAKEFQVIVPDLPGSGQSELLTEARSMTDYAEVLKALAEQEFGQKRFAMIGHSMGGYITMAYAEKYSATLQCFALFQSSAYADTNEKKEARQKGIEFIERQSAEAFNKATVPNMFAEHTQKNHPELVSKLITLANGISAEALIQYYHAMMQRPDRTEVLKSFNRPVLFVVGKFDLAVPMQATMEQSHLPANSTVEILEHSGHMGIWEEESKAEKLLEDFLNESFKD